MHSHLFNLAIPFAGYNKAVGSEIGLQLFDLVLERRTKNTFLETETTEWMGKKIATLGLVLNSSRQARD